MDEIQAIWEQSHLEMKGLLLKKIKSPDDVNDILHDIFLKIVRHQDKIKQADSIHHYILGITRNALNDYFRAKKQKMPDLTPNSEMVDDNSDDNLNEAIAACCVNSFMRILPEKYRQALVLTEFESVSQKELAARLEISYSGAKSRVQRGREKLKALIIACCALETDRYGNVLSTDYKNCAC